MPLARCPKCDEIVSIKPTGEAIGTGGTATWWRIASHSSGEKSTVAGMEVEVRCEGSGTKV